MCLNNDMTLGGLNQILNFFDYLYKTCNFQFCWPVIFFGNNKKLKKDENLFYSAVDRLIFLEKTFH